MTSPSTPKVNAKTNSGLVDDHDPNAIGQGQDKQKPQWKQAEDRPAAKEKLNPAHPETFKDNPHDA
jgi:hypothetical protein